MALVPALDPSAPNDWFLFVGNDNDFITQSGLQDSVAYAHPSGMENDSMLLVYRLTLPGRMNNISSRAQTGTGVATHIVGFAVNGPRPKQMLIRGVGPSLANYGVTGALADPALTIFNAAGQTVFTNDNWSDATNNPADLRAAAQASGAFALAEGSRDAALLLQLDPGTYTAQVSGAGGATGISLLEVYELP